jgi:hypothetical protein
MSRVATFSIPIIDHFTSRSNTALGLFPSPHLFLLKCIRRISPTLALRISSPAFSSLIQELLDQIAVMSGDGILGLYGDDFVETARARGGDAFLLSVPDD